MSMPATMIREDFFHRELNQLDDRCDQPGCSAQAYMLAVLNEVGELAFCGHHGTVNRGKLEQQGFKIQDETFRLLARAHIDTETDED